MSSYKKKTNQVATTRNSFTIFIDYLDNWWHYYLLSQQFHVVDFGRKCFLNNYLNCFYHLPKRTCKDSSLVEFEYFSFAFLINTKSEAFWI